MTKGRRWFAGVGLVTLVPGLVSTAALKQSVATATEADLGSIPRVECGSLHALRLHRFEDRSAQVLCGHRVLVRISVPAR